MHEMSLARAIVVELDRLLADFGPRARVVSVALEVGALRAVVPEAMQFCFQAATRGTRAEEAYLSIQVVAATGKCRTCGVERTVTELDFFCAECDGMLDVRDGRELLLRGVEIDDPEADPKTGSPPLH